MPPQSSAIRTQKESTKKLKTQKHSTEAQRDQVSGARWQKEISEDGWQTPSLGLRNHRAQNVWLVVHFYVPDRIIHPKSQFWSSHCLVQGQWPFNLRNRLLNLHSNSSETWSHLPIPLIFSYISLYILHSSGMGWITNHSLFIHPNMGPGVRYC